MSDTKSPKKIVETIETALTGKTRQVELAVVALLADGHLLIEDVPGVGKTTLAKAMVRSFQGTFSRIQFTSDLLPSDIIGVSVWDGDQKEFRFKEGPVFSNLILADEINRASPKTQSALLEAMSENQVSVDGSTMKLPQPFMVIATQNAEDSYGTYPLPESQMDRFTIRLSLGYTDSETERRIISRKTVGEPGDAIEPVVSVEDIARLKEKIEGVRVDDSITDYIMRIVQGTRSSNVVSQGAGPRGGMALHRCARALATLRGRDFVLADDVKALAAPVLAHRIIPENSRGTGGRKLCNRIVEDIMDAIEIPI